MITRKKGDNVKRPEKGKLQGMGLMGQPSKGR